LLLLLLPLLGVERRGAGTCMSASAPRDDPGRRVVVDRRLPNDRVRLAASRWAVCIAEKETTANESSRREKRANKISCVARANGPLPRNLAEQRKRTCQNGGIVALEAVGDERGDDAVIELGLAAGLAKDPVKREDGALGAAHLQRLGRQWRRRLGRQGRMVQLQRGRQKAPDAVVVVVIILEGGTDPHRHLNGRVPVVVVVVDFVFRWHASNFGRTYRHRLKPESVYSGLRFVFQCIGRVIVLLGVPRAAVAFADTPDLCSSGPLNLHREIDIRAVVLDEAQRFSTDSCPAHVRKLGSHGRDAMRLRFFGQRSTRASSLIKEGQRGHDATVVSSLKSSWSKAKSDSRWKYFSYDAIQEF
jgi:hypothetical protein